MESLHIKIQHIFAMGATQKPEGLTYHVRKCIPSFVCAKVERLQG